MKDKAKGKKKMKLNFMEGKNSYKQMEHQVTIKKVTINNLQEATLRVTSSAQ